MPDETAQAEFVATEVLRHRENGIHLKDQAVLFRTSSHSAQLELELARRNIPFVKFGGLRFLEAAHVKDVLSLLRWIDNPRGRLAGFRALRLLPGVGPATAARWLDALESVSEPLATLKAFAVPAAATSEWEGLVSLYRQLRRPTATGPRRSTRCSIGISLSSSGSTTTRRFASPTSRNCAELRRLTRAASDFSPS